VIVTAGVWPDLRGIDAAARGQWRPTTTNGECRTTGDIKGTRIALDQINGANFNKLEVAWRFKTDNLGTFPEC
jgi:quinoprotein glucose dehydrogenase